ncbi:MAG: MFS transporter [Candidatus Latescibacteria bacterium]|nr:MFS transporter [Candidatus Latescibacterota bacterium]
MMFAISGVVTPICLPEISKTLSTSFSEGGGMETARTVLVLLTLMVAGICARHWGKKIFITYGQYFLALGLILTSYADSYALLIMALMITGIGGGFTEALINPLVVDLHAEDSGKYLNIANAFYPIGVMAGALIFGELLTLGYSWRLMFRIAGIGALIMGVLFHISRFPTPIEAEHSSAHVISDILRQPGFWLFAAAIFLGAGVESSFTFWGRSYVETYLADVPRAGAIAVVIFAGTMAVGRLLSARLSEFMSLRTLMMRSAILGVLVSSAILFTNSLIAFYILLALAGFAAACFWPTILAEADACLSVDTTMLFVMLACFGIAGFGLTPWIMGVMGDSAGLKAGFLVIPGLFIGLILVLTLERRIPN